MSIKNESSKNILTGKITFLKFTFLLKMSEGMNDMVNLSTNGLQILPGHSLTNQEEEDQFSDRASVLEEELDEEVDAEEKEDDHDAIEEEEEVEEEEEDLKDSFAISEGEEEVEDEQEVEDQDKDVDADEDMIEPPEQAQSSADDDEESSAEEIVDNQQVEKRTPDMIYDSRTPVQEGSRRNLEVIISY